MKTLYFECNMGAAGDMLMAALFELLPDKAAFAAQMNQLGIPGVHYACEPVEKCGILGTHVSVCVNGMKEEAGKQLPQEVHHRSDLKQIERLISGLEVSDAVRRNAVAVFRLLAEAESHVHGKPVSEIHFHEVGTMDAVADIVGVCLLLEQLAPQRIIASPVHVGSGQVQCAHGLLPVPTPATAYLLQGVPIYGGSVQGELCTPTGAALLKHFADAFGSMPVMQVSQIGYGMGTKSFETANCVRALLGDTAEGQEQIVELSCNLDDMTPEAIGFAQEQLFAGGALDVYTVAIGMKKNRPGVQLCCLSTPEKRETLIQLLFRHTTTLGVREQTCSRYTLNRTLHAAETEFGTIQVKHAEGWGISREKLEYEDAARIAREMHLPLSAVYKKVNL